MINESNNGLNETNKEIKENYKKKSLSKKIFILESVNEEKRIKEEEKRIKE